jgi:hypothetical protein
MRDAKRTDGDSVSPRQAAERLTDLAYGLTAGGPLELTVNHERRSVPLGDELRLHRALTVDGERVHLDLRLSWSAHPHEGDMMGHGPPHRRGHPAPARRRFPRPRELRRAGLGACGPRSSKPVMTTHPRGTEA